MKIPAGDGLSVGGKLRVRQRRVEDDGEESRGLGTRMEMAEVEGLEIGAEEEQRLALVLRVAQLTDAGLKEGGEDDGEVEDISE